MRKKISYMSQYIESEKVELKVKYTDTICRESVAYRGASVLAPCWLAFPWTRSSIKYGAVTYMSALPAAALACGSWGRPMYSGTDTFN